MASLPPSKIEVIMNQSSAKSSIINDSARCQHRTISGKRCRLRVVDPRSGLCFRHSAKQSELLHAADLRTVLAGEVTQFECAYDLNKFLSNLLLLLSEDRVAPRRAAVMAYTCNLLLRTLGSRQRELEESDDEPVRLEIDLPRPDRSSGSQNQGTISPAPAYPSSTTPTVPLCTEEVLR